MAIDAGRLLLAPRKDDPEVTAYLEAENAYTDAVMKPTEAFQEALYERDAGAHQGGRQTVPYRHGRLALLLAHGDGQAVPDLLPQGGRLEAPEEITLDLNALAEGQPFLALGAYAVSDDGQLAGLQPSTTPASASTRCT